MFDRCKRTSLALVTLQKVLYKPVKDETRANDTDDFSTQPCRTFDRKTFARQAKTSKTAYPRKPTHERRVRRRRRWWRHRRRVDERRDVKTDRTLQRTAETERVPTQVMIQYFLLRCIYTCDWTAHNNGRMRQWFLKVVYCALLYLLRYDTKQKTKFLRIFLRLFFRFALSCKRTKCF